jgi:hypothetical protein
MTATVLVTDGEPRAVLAVVRSLGRAAHHVIVASDSGSSLAGASRYARGEFGVGDLLQNPRDFADEMGRLVRDHAVDVLLPIGDVATLALLPRRERIPALHHTRSRAGAGVPSRPQAARRCRGSGAWHCASGTVRARVGGRRRTPRHRPSSFPVVVKPVRSAVEATGGRRDQHGVRHAQDGAELQRVLASFPPQAYPFSCSSGGRRAPTHSLGLLSLMLAMVGYAVTSALLTFAWLDPVYVIGALMVALYVVAEQRLSGASRATAGGRRAATRVTQHRSAPPSESGFIPAPN